MKKALTHLIATDNDNPTQVHICKMPQSGRLTLHAAGGEFRKYTSMGYKPHFLYITTDEEIKIGDWAITKKGELFMATKDNNHPIYGDRKIVATDNPELWYKGLRHEADSVRKQIVAKIPTSFLREYVEKQPKEVMLEYEEDMNSQQIGKANRIA
jgi:hypothetical protein